MAKDSSRKIELQLHNISKKFVNEWIFRGIELSTESSKNYAVIGPNGSGKSTLLQCISGLVPLTSGTLSYRIKGCEVSPDEIYRHIAIVSPASELIEEFTLAELFVFHSKFKSIGFETVEQFAEAIFLEKHLNKQIKNYSSGMKQRLKLGLAFFSENDILLFDEPTTNLDEFGCKWYADNCAALSHDKFIMVASNQKHEYEFCDNYINIVDFK